MPCRAALFGAIRWPAPPPRRPSPKGRRLSRRSEEAFVAGLLHDIGKVVLNTYLKEQFVRVLIRAAGGEVTYAEAEREIFGFDHAEAGARLLERWNLPSSLVSAVRYHHAPLEANPVLPASLHRPCRRRHVPDARHRPGHGRPGLRP